MNDRIRLHREHRPPWRTLEAPSSVRRRGSPGSSPLQRRGARLPHLVDERPARPGRRRNPRSLGRELRALAAASWPAVVVGNEVGWAPVPELAALAPLPRSGWLARPADGRGGGRGLAPGRRLPAPPQVTRWRSRRSLSLRAERDRRLGPVEIGRLQLFLLGREAHRAPPGACVLHGFSYSSSAARHCWRTLSASAIQLHAIAIGTCSTRNWQRSHPIENRLLGERLCCACHCAMSGSPSGWARGGEGSRWRPGLARSRGRSTSGARAAGGGHRGVGRQHQRRDQRGIVVLGSGPHAHLRRRTIRLRNTSVPRFKRRSTGRAALAGMRGRSRNRGVANAPWSSPLASHPSFGSQLATSRLPRRSPARVRTTTLASTTRRMPCGLPLRCFPSCLE